MSVETLALTKRHDYVCRLKPIQHRHWIPEETVQHVPADASWRLPGWGESLRFEGGKSALVQATQERVKAFVVVVDLDGGLGGDYAGDAPDVLDDAVSPRDREGQEQRVEGW